MATCTRIGLDRPAPSMPPLWREQDSGRSLEQAIENGANHLLSLQAEEGYWLGELEADTTLESDYIYYLFVLGRAEPGRIAKLANYVRRRQLPDGGWNCEAPNHSQCSSFHTTICVLEGLLDYERLVRKSAAIARTRTSCCASFCPKTAISG